MESGQKVANGPERYSLRKIQRGRRIKRPRTRNLRTKLVVAKV